MSFEEMIITLNDVSTLLGIPVVGRSISSSVDKLLDKDAVILLVNELGVLSEQTVEELASVQGQSVRMEWLRDLFS